MQGNSWSQITKENSAEKIRRKICQPKTKNRLAHELPQIRQPGPKFRRKTYQQIRLSNLEVLARFFSIERVCSWRRLQRMDYGTLFGCLLGMVEAPMLKFTCNPSAAAGGREVFCAPFQTTRLVQSARFENDPKKISPRDSANSSNPTLQGHRFPLWAIGSPYANNDMDVTLVAEALIPSRFFINSVSEKTARP